MTMRAKRCQTAQAQTSMLVSLCRIYIGPFYLNEFTRKCPRIKIDKKNYNVQKGIQCKITTPQLVPKQL